MRAPTARPRPAAIAALLRALIAGLVLAAIGAGGAHADDDRERREEARREFAAGQAADRRKDWQTAIEHYLRANDLVPHPFAVYNIAVNYERLDKLREAATWYERYLGGTTDAAERERVQRALQELLTRPAPLEVRSSPSGARVYIDAVPVGVTPFRGTIRGGFHRVSAELDGRREQRDVTVAYAEPVSLDLVLRAPTGTLRVMGAPFGAAVQIDGAWAGTVPARLTVPAGRHTVRVTSLGHAPFETTVDVAADREERVEARLARGGPGSDLGPGGVPGPRVIRAAYLLGFAGGTDVRGSGGIGLLELGLRIGPVDTTARIGRAAGLTSIDLLVRWMLLRDRRFAPFVSLAFTTVEKGLGYAATSGLRWDVLRGEHTSLSVLAESGLRYYTSSPDPEPGEARVTTTGVIVPIMASVLVSYR